MLDEREAVGSGETASSRAPSTEALAVLETIFGRDYAREFDVRLWDGTTVPARVDRRFSLIVRAPWALRFALRPPIAAHVAQALVAGAIALDGDLERALETMHAAVGRLGPAAIPRLIRHVLALPKPAQPPRSRRRAHLHGRRHSVARDRAAIAHHYDQPVAFFETFLDPGLVYSCAYFDGPDPAAISLEAAQSAKLDHILRKLRLRPGQRLLDIGCGYGALAMRAAEGYGAQVLAVTLSREQCAEARRRVIARGLGERVRIELRDYRELRGEGPFDAVASVGMVEHVGRPKLRRYAREVMALLRPGGAFLNHGIVGQMLEGVRHGRDQFIERYVFPDGDVFPATAFLDVAERVGFELRDVENLREHYARTLRLWVANLERHRAQAVAAAGEEAYHVWRLYMAGCAAAFARGDLGLMQTLLLKPGPGGHSELPWTRRDLYA